eukprot:symbB.v1.2.020953.t1/scaffold1770.1/size102271/2
MAGNVLEITGPFLLNFLPTRDLCRFLAVHRNPLRILAAPQLSEKRCHRRLTTAARELREELRRGVWPEPKKQRQLMQLLSDLEGATSCKTSLVHDFTALLVQNCCRVQTAATKVLALIGDESEESMKRSIVQHFIRLATCAPDAVMRGEAVDAIALVLRSWRSDSVEEQSLLTALGHGLKDHCPHVCAKAMSALSSISNSSDRKLSTQAALEVAARLLKDEDRFVRARACATLGRCVELTPEMVELLSLRCSLDTSPEVQHVARAALRGAQMLSLASVPGFTADTNPPVDGGPYIAS